MSIEDDCPAPCGSSPHPRGGPANSQPLLATGLRKSYGPHVALESCNISLGSGDLVGLLGPNGAGKTTTMSTIAGVLEPDSGTVLINGQDLSADSKAARRQLGFAPQLIAQAGVNTRIELKTRIPLSADWSKSLPGVVELNL